MQILALDPATRCGYAHTNGECGSWDLGTSGSEHAGRPLVRLMELLTNVLRWWPTDKIAYELASFGSNNRTTAARHEQLRGIILAVAAKHNLPVVPVYPATIKSLARIPPARGERRSTERKTQLVCQAARTLLGVDTKGDGDAADALFCLEAAKQLVRLLPRLLQGRPQRYAGTTRRVGAASRRRS